MNRKRLSYYWDRIWLGIFLWGSAIMLLSYNKAISEILGSPYSLKIALILTLFSIGSVFLGSLIIVGGLLRPYSEEDHTPNIELHCEPRKEDLIKEYELSQEMHNYYGRIVWEIGSIFIGGGLAMVGLFATRIPRPSIDFAFVALTFTILMMVFYFMVRRWREIAEIHLARCRQIEIKLGLQQHGLVKKANEPSGVEIVQGSKRQWIRVPFPTGWGIVKGLSIGLSIMVWIMALYFAV